jgi:hypothetical protein
MTLTLGTLDDGRLQVWNDLKCKTKLSTLPGAGWSEWISHPIPRGYGYVSLPCAILAGGGVLSVYCSATTIVPAKAGGVGSVIPVILALNEYPPNGTIVDWAPALGEWPSGSVVVAGGVLGGQRSSDQPGGTAGAQSPIQLLLSSLTGELLGKLLNSGVWGPFKPTAPSDTGPVWLLYGANSSDTFPYSMMWTGTKQWGGSQPFLKLYFSITTPVNYSFGGYQQPFEWTPWKEFSPGLEQTTGGAASVAASLLPGGFIQMFASDTNGDLWTIWQEPGPENSVVWISAWRPFPLPGGKKIATLNPANSDAPPPSLDRASLALGQVVTGELQLFAKDEDNTVWTTWKTSVNPGAPWSDWTKF